MDRGYGKVRPLEGGLEAWVEAGYPTEHFDEPATGPVNEPG